MAEKVTFRSMVEDTGACCPHGYLAIEDIKCRGRSRNLTGPQVALKFGLEPGSGINILTRWRKGAYRCEQKVNCILKKAGLVDDDIPTLSPESRAFAALKGPAYKVYLTEGEPQRVGEPLRGVVISQSEYPWLYFILSFPPNDPQLPKIRLGDRLWVENIVWGTVVDIDGQTVTLLPPGSKHLCRDRIIFQRRNRGAGWGEP